MRRFLFLLMAVPALTMAMAVPAKIAKVGSATYRKLVFTVYDATLYAPGGVYDASKPYALALTYHMNFTSDEIVGRSLDEIRHAQSVTPEEAARWRQELGEVIPNVKEGDTVRATVRANHTMQFTHNGTPTGTVRDAGLIGPFMNIWLGPNTSEPAMRDALLGKVSH